MHSPSPTTRRQALGRFTAAFTTGLMACEAVGAHESEGSVKVNPLFQKELADHPGEQVSMTVVDYPPGTSSKPHKHHGPVFVYVLEGSVELQITGGPLTTVHAGGTFYEPPGGVHLVSRNASATAPAKLLAFIIGKTGTPVTSPAGTEK
jgi:quercetin dioxygenase-like cupin family protein